MKIAIIRLSAIGDIVFSLTAAAMIKQKYTNANITWIVDERFAEVVQDSPFVDKIESLKLKPLSLSLINREAAKIKALGSFDIALDLQGLIKSAVVTSFVNAEKKVGFSYKSAREGAASLFYTQRAVSDYQKNIVERYVDLLNTAFGGGFSIEGVCAKPKLLGYSQAHNPIDNGKKNILINMSASKPNKIYTWEKMKEVAKAFEGENLKIIGLNAPNMTLNDVKALIDSSDLVIGGDTGVTHMAWAMNTPSVTIFGATPHERNAFATEKNIMIGAKKEVNAKKLDYDDYSINNIKPQEIIEAARRVMC